MGHVKDRWKRKDGTPTARHGTGLRWQVWYTVEGEEKCGGSFAKEKAAKDKLVELENNIRRGAYVNPDNTTTVEEYLQQWSATRTHGARSAAQLSIYLRNHVYGTPFGATRLNSPQLPRITREWVADRSRALSRKTLELVVGNTRSGIRAARVDKLMNDDPFAGITLPKVEKPRIVPLRPEQVAAIADAIRPEFRAAVVAQAGLGLRIGEVLGLRVQDVDFMHGLVHVRRQSVADTLALAEPKTPRSIRAIPLPKTVHQELSAHIAKYPPSTHPDFMGVLFHSDTGRSASQSAYRRRAFTKTVRALHLADPMFPEKVTPHDLRHYYASVLLAAGESMIAVAELLGHKDAVLVMKVYGHLMPGREDRARSAIDASFAADSDGPVTARAISKP